ncbi:MAG: hypothetical protein JSV47_08700 [Deltaproteobacteria bacterium]|nr:MAG: hypothetical protein JSV47_08700 [Deltaproteobacteria bacterium]
MKKGRLAYYITPHGLGHAVRSLEVIRHLLQIEPNLEIFVVTTLPEFLLDHKLRKSLSLREKQMDIGLVQLDSLQFDLDLSRQAVESLRHHRDALVEEEIHFLKTNEISAVVADIPFLPFVAASQQSIPAIGIGNFTWDWIYNAYAASDPRWAPLVDWIGECYQKCGLFLQLPMHGDCSVFPNIKDVPLVARLAKRNRDETRNILHLQPDQRLYLVSFAYLDLDETAQKRVQDITNAVFLYKYPLNFQFDNGICLDQHPLTYEDVVAAVDGVITKPGYGIVADCLAHGTPIIYTDRGFFPEYDILVQEIEKQLTTVYLSSSDLYGGRWKSAIMQLDSQTRTIPDIPCNGAEVCAEIILQHLS